VERKLDVKGEWSRGICGAKFGCINEWLTGNCGARVGFTGRVYERELWIAIWMYRASG